MKARTLSLFVVARAPRDRRYRSGASAFRSSRRRSAPLEASVAPRPTSGTGSRSYVAPIILDDERNLFLQLTEPHQFVESSRRSSGSGANSPGSPDPLGPGYRNRYESFRQARGDRVRGAHERRRTGRRAPRRSRLIQEFRDCNEVFRSVEVWTYAQPDAAARASRGASIPLLSARHSADRASSGIRRFPSARSSLPPRAWRPLTQACRRRRRSAGRDGGRPGRRRRNGCPNNAVPQTCDAACASS